MNTTLLAASDTGSGQHPSAGVDRLVRRTGLALVRWSERRDSSASLTASEVDLLRSAQAVHEQDRRWLQLTVVARPYL